MKNSKIFSMGVVLVLLIVIAQPNSWGFQNEPDGFRGIKWGTNIKDLPDMALGHSEGNYKMYIRKNDKMRIGEASLKIIIYNFYKERFCGVNISFEGFSNFNMIKSTLFQVYGDGYQKNRYIEDYSWHGGDVLIGLKYSTITTKGKVMYFYKPIWNERDSDKKKGAKKGASDL